MSKKSLPEPKKSENDFILFKQSGFNVIYINFQKSYLVNY